MVRQVSHICSRGKRTADTIWGVKKMKPEECSKLNECYRVKIVMDKEMEDSQLAEYVRKVCAKCMPEECGVESIRGREGDDNK